ncbi:HalD/BesD family halogenase [Streptomyces sp. 4.24]|uniref:YxiG-like protein n=1 Tax=Streptomyces tritrimontium TaxID=3406573 RepID=UPI003BB58E2B
MDTAELQRTLDENIEQLVVHHGYTNYMRDYEVIVHVWNGPQIPPTYLRYLFRYCVEARCETFLSMDTWRDSLDDRLLDPETADPDLGGYVWGVRFHELYGAELRPESEATRRWSKAVGIDFREVRIETNAHDLTLLFSDLEVSEVPVGYAPFVTD